MSSMIVHWKKISASEFVAKWQGLNLALRYLGEESRWRAYVNEKRCVPAWNSYFAAQETVDSIINKLLAEVRPALLAQQGRSSAERIVRHHGQIRKR